MLGWWLCKLGGLNKVSNLDFMSFLLVMGKVISANRLPKPRDNERGEVVDPQIKVLYNLYVLSAMFRMFILDRASLSFS